MRHVIVGAGQAGISAAEVLRAEGGAGHEIVVLTADADEPHDHPPLSKGYLRGDEDTGAVRLREPEWYAENAVELRRERASRIAPDRDAVELEGGGEVAFDRLLLATGGAARRLRVPGADLPGVMTLRTFADARALRAAAREHPPAVVVGGGFIGVEVAASLRALHCPVDLLMLEDVVLERALGATLGAELGDRLGALGVRVHPATSVTAFAGEARLRAVERDRGGPLEAGLAVVGAGMVPAVEVAERSGLDLALGGVACDGAMRTSRPGVFAAGDIAAVESSVAGERIRVEHWAEALNQGKLAARSMLGQPVDYDRVPYFFSDVGATSIEYVGVGGAIEDEFTVAHGGGLVSCHMRGGRVVGVAAFDAGDALDAGRELVRAGAGADAARRALGGGG